MLNKNASNVGTSVVASNYNKDVVKLQLVIDEDDGVIEKVDFKFFGSYDMLVKLENLTETLIGLSIDDATNIDIVDLGDNPEDMELLFNAIHSAVHSYIQRKIDTDIDLETTAEKLNS